MRILARSGVGPGTIWSAALLKCSRLKQKGKKVKVSGTYSSEDSDSPKPGHAQRHAGSRDVQRPWPTRPFARTPPGHTGEEDDQAMKTAAARTPAPAGPAWKSFCSWQPEAAQLIPFEGRFRKGTSSDQSVLIIKFFPACWTEGNRTYSDLQCSLRGGQ